MSEDLGKFRKKLDDFFVRIVFLATMPWSGNLISVS